VCGICGQINNDSSRPVDRAVLEGMNGAIRHRGPDSDGYYVKKNVGLAVRRLAVIDLVTGDQPISNEDGTIWIVFNGEIYNHKQLRLELKNNGHVFSTQSDTEVIVHLYEDHGPDCMEHLRGMFAFAIWDDNLQLLLLARDRLGQKPLYYTEHDGVLLFGSELKSILQFPGLPREVDHEAIYHYLTLQYVPDPWTAFKNVHKLPPAHRLIWRNGRYEIQRYWDLVFEPKHEAPWSELKLQLRQTIAEAVRFRLISDVPLGAHLSGGIDSSIVVGHMSEMMDRPVKTFSIGFKEDSFSELAYARQIAQKFGTDHHEFILEPEALDVLPKLVEAFDEPFADPAAIPTWYLSQVTRQHVTVALNGDGGDETFAGYQRYYADSLADGYRQVPSFLRKSFFDRILHLLPVQADRPVEISYFSGLRQLTRAADMPHSASVIRWGTYFSEAEKLTLYNDDLLRVINAAPSDTILQESFRRAKAANRLDRTLYTDVSNYLPGALLPKVDRTTMAHSLEARSPFLDHKLMELAARLPAKWKIKGKQTKMVLRHLYADLLPGEVLKRGKMGFSLPMSLWFRGPLYQPAKDILLAADSRLRSFFKVNTITDLIEENKRGQANNGKRIWALLMLELWQRKYIG